MNNRKIDEIGEFIQSHSKILAFSGKTKTALQASTEISVLDLAGISGVLDYTPSEYTFTAFAGTTIDDINHMLAENGQFLPFDSLFGQLGATLGGTVAANMNGPGRYRYGGIRDFLLGVEYFDDQARLIRSGGKVVKNAAGFDIPKLMVGSLGCYGALVELSFKVFPHPVDYMTAVSNHLTLKDALESLIRLSTSPIEIFCLELLPVEEVYQLQIRLGGKRELFADRIEQLKQYTGDIEIMDGDSEQIYWNNIREFQWLPMDAILVKIPITPRLLPKLEKFLFNYESMRRYSVGASVAWVAWSQSLDSLDQFLKREDLSGLSILGQTDQIRLGAWNPGKFDQLIKDALDPSGKWIKL